jgi:hypothetical protein
MNYKTKSAYITALMLEQALVLVDIGYDSAVQERGYKN